MLEMGMGMKKQWMESTVSGEGGEVKPKKLS
jgi:hypothetical protein